MCVHPRHYSVSGHVRNGQTNPREGKIKTLSPIFDMSKVVVGEFQSSRGIGRDPFASQT